MNKRIASLLLMIFVIAGVFAGSVYADIEKESPILAEQVAAGTLPALEDRIPTEADVYVESEYSPEETPVYGGTIRTNNGGMWYYGPNAEEPLFRLLDDSTVEPNVAKGYDLSDDGLVYTIHLREGMKWSDGTPFTATDCVYYYNYFPEILDSIASLRKYQADFNILSVIDDENAKDIENTWRYFKKHGFRFLQFIPYVDEVNGISLSTEAYGRFLKRSFDLWYEDWSNGSYISVRHIDNYIRILMGEPPENCAMCGICGSYFVVEANGDLFPCDFYCTGEYRLGSIFDENPFAENEKQKSFIDRSKIIHSNCKSCKYYILCRGGCRRDRTEDLQKNRYCSAYKVFFDHAAARMTMIASSLKMGQNR